MIDPDRWFIVVNPVSGGGRALRFQPRLTAALRRAGLPYDCVVSGAPGDAARHFASAVREGRRRLLSVGGDGTLNELINGLRASAAPADECLVAAAAGGTGNDWSRTMQIPDDPESLVACMARGRARRVDIAVAEGTDGKQIAFHSVAGAGLDAEVLRRTPRSGPRALAYLFGLARTLAAYRAPEFEITVDGRITRGRFLLVLASIGPRCGGGMRLAPGAVVDDGLLDLLTIDPLPFSGALARLPKLFDGRLAGDPAFHVVRCRSATIRCESNCGVEVDGQESGSTPVTVTVRPGALRALDCRDSAE
ncbi:MAG TPA: diacylglycerol kinase family protein [Steroidobacteraceae bacterium]